MQFDVHAIYLVITQNQELKRGYGCQFQCTTVEYNLKPNSQVVQVMASQLFDLKLQKMYMIMYSNNPYLAQKILGINPYVILMHQEILTKSPISKIKKMLNSLSLLDYNIKNNLAIGDISLKTFIMEN